MAELSLSFQRPVGYLCGRYLSSDAGLALLTDPISGMPTLGVSRHTLTLSSLPTSGSNAQCSTPITSTLTASSCSDLFAQWRLRESWRSARMGGLYTPEETSWAKIKNLRYSQAEGRHELFEKRAAGA